MEGSRLTIVSEERNAGKALQLVAAFFMIPVLGSLVLYFNDKGSAGALVGAFAFLVVSAMLFLIGRFQNNKYWSLGETPLTLYPGECLIGKPVRGKITIPQNDFKRVSRLSLTCWHYAKASSSDSRYTKVWDTSIETSFEFTDGQTQLSFEFVVPEGRKPTVQSGFSKNKYHWELGFEYVENMESIKRTWKIPVRKS